jgi:hypothetical protein
MIEASRVPLTAATMAHADMGQRMLVGLFIFVGLLVGAVVIVVFVGLFKLEGDQAKAEKNATQILDQTFDGRSDVSFELNMRTLKYDTLVIGAKERGYKVASQALNQYGAGMILFEKLETPRPPSAG